MCIRDRLDSNNIGIHPEQSYLPPNSSHWLGTDLFGRDVLTRVLQGTRTALSVGVVTSLIAILLGLAFGASAGLFGGLWDAIVRWIYTTLDSIPYILLVSAAAYSMGQGLTNLYFTLGCTGWVKTCRIVRSETLKLKGSHHYLAAQNLGTPWYKLLSFSILPNLKHILFVRFGLFFVFAIKFEVILSFIGLGMEPGTPSWGAIISDSRTELIQGIWWNFTAASVFLFALVFAVHWLLATVSDEKYQLFYGEN